MAARRVAQSSINWTALAERIPESAKGNFLSFKSRSDNNLRKMLALPENPPKIDWAFYKSKVANPALVETFQKKYESLQIAFPKDPITAQINEQEKALDALVAAEIKASNDRIAAHEQELATLAAQLPVSKMTLQELGEAYPELVVDAINDPTPWPHDPEEIAEWRAQLAAKEGSGGSGEHAHAPAAAAAAH